MTTGALIFAYNNESFDYVRMAAWSAHNIRRHLGIPVALVTDRATDHEFDQVIIHPAPARDSRWFEDAGQRVTWNNQSRPDAYDLTPWHRTLLLDADYVVASDQLSKIVSQTTQPVLCHGRALDITGMNDFQALNRLGRYDWPLRWATVVVFDQHPHAQMVFGCMKMIRDNWTHYQQIYQERSRTYRNDHALTIAMNIANGHWPDRHEIPWDLVTVMPEHRLTQIDSDRYRVDFKRPDNRMAWIEIAGQDFHAMGKQSLMDMITCPA